MNAENIAKRTKKAKTQWHGEYHELNCLPKPCVSHPMSRIWTPKTDKTWVQFPTRRDVWLADGRSSTDTILGDLFLIFGIIHQSGRTVPHGFALQEVEAETAAVCCDAFPMWDRWRTRRFGDSWAGSSQLPIITSPWLPLVMPSLVGVYTKQIPNSHHSSLLFLVDGFEYSALFSRQLDKVSFLFGCWSQMSNPEKKTENPRVYCIWPNMG